MRYLQARYGDKVRIEQSVTVTEMLDRVRAGGVDATVQDAPAATYYVQQGRYPGLKVIDDPVGFGYYVLLTRPEDAGLRGQLNDAIRQGIRGGTLRELYQKYGLWNAAQQRLSYLADQPWPAVAEELDAEAEYQALPPPRFREVLDKLLLAAGMTLFLAFASFPMALAPGPRRRRRSRVRPLARPGRVVRLRRGAPRHAAPAPAVRDLLPAVAARAHPRLRVAQARCRRTSTWPRSWGWR